MVVFSLGLRTGCGCRFLVAVQKEAQAVAVGDFGSVMQLGDNQLSRLTQLLFAVS